MHGVVHGAAAPCKHSGASAAWCKTVCCIHHLCRSAARGRTPGLARGSPHFRISAHMLLFLCASGGSLPAARCLSAFRWLARSLPRALSANSSGYTAAAETAPASARARTVTAAFPLLMCTGGRTLGRHRCTRCHVINSVTRARLPPSPVSSPHAKRLLLPRAPRAGVTVLAEAAMADAVAGPTSATPPLTFAAFLEKMRCAEASDVVKAIKNFLTEFSTQTPDAERDSERVQARRRRSRAVCDCADAFPTHTGLSAHHGGCLSLAPALAQRELRRARGFRRGAGEIPDDQDIRAHLCRRAGRPRARPGAPALPRVPLRLGLNAAPSPPLSPEPGAQLAARGAPVHPPGAPGDSGAPPVRWALRWAFA